MSVASVVTALIKESPYLARASLLLDWDLPHQLPEREYYYKGRLNLVSCVTNVRLNLSADNFNSMKQTRKPGRPREWVLNEETIEIHKLSTKLKTQNPRAHWSAINDMLKTQLEQMGRNGLLLKIDKLWGLMRQVIPLPPKCICGNRIYSYTYNKIENEYEHYWEIFARCVNPNCRYIRRYLPSASYKWSRPKSIIGELEKTPTFYEMDGQKVEDAKW